MLASLRDHGVRTPDRAWVDALAIVARIERASPMLRRLARREASWRLDERVALRDGFDPDRLALPVGGAGAAHAVGERLAADCIVLGNLPESPLRLRAFYANAGLTLALHRVPILGRSALLRGSRVAERLTGSSTLIVPYQHERQRRLRHAWAVEELLRGRQATRREWPDLVDRVAAGVSQLWCGGRLRRRALTSTVPWLSGERVSELLGSMQLEPVDGPRFGRAIHDLVVGDGRILAGWTHGDPSPNNVIRLGDGGLALVDWERAGRNPIGLDACRMLAALDDPAPALALLEARVAAMGHRDVLPVRLQAAAALIGLLPTWAGQADSWREAGRANAYRARNRRRLRLLEHLLQV